MFFFVDVSLPYFSDLKNFRLESLEVEGKFGELLEVFLLTGLHLGAFVQVHFL